MTPPWCIAGGILACALMFLGAWRIHDEEIPNIALLTAAFFIATQIHVKAPTGQSVHLLLNGLLGIVLGRRALLAIPIGLVLQACLFGHGGYSTLGVNACVMALPALLAALLFSGLRRLPWIRHPWGRGSLVFCSALALLVSLVYSIAFLFSDEARAGEIVLHPGSLLGSAVLAGLAVWLERKLENTPEFPLGLFIGELTVLATILLSCLALLAGFPFDTSQEPFQKMVAIAFVAHIPVAAIEGVVMGFIIGFLARVKPEMIGWKSVDSSP